MAKDIDFENTNDSMNNGDDININVARKLIFTLTFILSRITKKSNAERIPNI